MMTNRDFAIGVKMNANFVNVRELKSARRFFHHVKLFQTVFAAF